MSQAALRSRPGTRWAIGALVRARRDGPFATRVVIGYKPDGRCMTSYVSPPPWLRGRILVDDVDRLRAADRREAS